MSFYTLVFSINALNLSQLNNYKIGAEASIKWKSKRTLELKDT